MAYIERSHLGQIEGLGTFGYDSNVPPIDSFSGEYRFLSNFWPAPVLYDGLVYPTVEHAFQAAKTTDTAQRAMIRLSASPGAAKRAGRRVPLRPDWDDIRVVVMHQLLAQKFSRDSALAEQLLDTYPCELVEGNTWGDRFWGVCQGTGQNRLGILLMERRSTLLRPDQVMDIPF